MTAQLFPTIYTLIGYRASDNLRLDTDQLDTSNSQRVNIGKHLGTL